MNYQEAKKIREKSYISFLTEKLSEGRGLGAALKATSSERSEAKAMGYKEKFDPMNIVKFLTGGSKFAPALLGSMMGRSQQDIQYFSGSKAKEVGSTATKIGQIDSNNEVLDVLSKIYSLLKSSNENDILRREKENNFREEQELEKERRHRELIAAITGKKISTAAPTATSVKTDDGGGLLSSILGIVTGLIDDAIKGVMAIVSGIQSFISMITSAFGGGLATAGRLLMGLGRFLLFNPVGLAIVAGAGIAYAIWKILKNPNSFEDPNSELSQGLANAERVGGLAGVKDEADKRKKLPEYERTMLEIKDYEKLYNEGEKLNDKQLEGFSKRSAIASKAVEDYKAERDKLQQKNETATPVPPRPAQQADVRSVDNAIAAQQGNVPGTMNQVTESPSKLNSVTGENIELNLPSTPESVTNAQTLNNTNISPVIKQKPKQSIPSVRNTEDSFQRMLLTSLRVV